MRSNETRKYEMLVRVRDFGKARSQAFPETTEGGQAFATVAAAVTQLAAYDDSKTRSSERGKQAKAMAREALVGELRTISRTARVIGRKTPGFQDRFKMPSSRPADQAVLGAGRVFAEEAGPVKDRFIAHGMADTFVADLIALVETFDQAIRGRESGKEQKAVAQKGLAAALSSGMAAARALDVIVTNRLGQDADAIAAWEHGRKVARARRPSNTPGTAEEPASSPGVAPTSQGAPASVEPNTVTPLA